MLVRSKSMLQIVEPKMEGAGGVKKQKLLRVPVQPSYTKQDDINNRIKSDWLAYTPEAEVKYPIGVQKRLVGACNSSLEEQLIVDNALQNPHEDDSASNQLQQDTYDSDSSSDRHHYIADATIAAATRVTLEALNISTSSEDKQMLLHHIVCVLQIGESFGAMRGGMTIKHPPRDEQAELTMHNDSQFLLESMQQNAKKYRTAYSDNVQQREGGGVAQYVDLEQNLQDQADDDQAKYLDIIKVARRILHIFQQLVDKDGPQRTEILVFFAYYMDKRTYEALIPANGELPSLTGRGIFDTNFLRALLEDSIDTVMKQLILVMFEVLCVGIVFEKNDKKHVVQEGGVEEKFEHIQQRQKITLEEFIRILTCIRREAGNSVDMRNSMYKLTTMLKTPWTPCHDCKLYNMASKFVQKVQYKRPFIVDAKSQLATFTDCLELERLVKCVRAELDRQEREKAKSKRKSCVIA